MDNPLPTDTAFCLACGYSLKNLPANRCPECGREFDPADPRTMSIGAPLRGWQRRFLRPIGWPAISLALIGTAGLVYLGHRPHLWPEPWSVMRDEFRWPTKDLRPFTVPDIVFYVSVVLWWPLFVLLAVKLFARPLIPRVARRANVHGPRPRRRLAIVVTAFILSAFCIVFSWQQRIGQRWMARVPATATTLPPTYLWSGYQPQPLSAQPLFGMPQKQCEILLGNLIEDLPHANDRMTALRLLVEGRGKAALPAIIVASQSENDPMIAAWELRLIGLCREPATAALLIARLHDARPEIRAAAADAVGILRHPSYSVGVPGSYWIVEPMRLESKPPILLDGVVGPTLVSQDGYNSEEAHDLANDAPIDIEPQVRSILQKMMVEGVTTEEREAAARTLVGWPPDSYTFRIVEWGVWIDINGHFALAKSIIGEIPPFVHRTGNPTASFDDYFMDWGGAVTKPILHITSNVELAADLEIRIRQGRPWFAFPIPDDFGIGDRPNTIYTTEEIVGVAADNVPSGKTRPAPDDFAAPTIKGLPDCREGYPWLEPHHRMYMPDGWGQKPGVIYNLGLRWQSLIISPVQLPWMTPPTVPVDPRFNWWSRLREVPSDWVANRGEAERFLYYDGPTRSEVPITARLDPSGKRLSLAASPGGKQESYDSRRDDDVKFEPVKSTLRANLAAHDGFYIDVHHGIARSQYIRIDADTTISIQDDLPLHGDALIRRFRDMLLAYGLTGPEAEGLIATWTPQFFQTEGRRFVLRMSPADYDRQCPMQVRPKPTEIVRLGLVLTEFDTPATTRP